LYVSALKVKLMLRRPINQLVAQGIMPREYPALCEEVSGLGKKEWRVHCYWGAVAKRVIHTGWARSHSNLMQVTAKRLDLVVTV
jgi:hypothetical protein